MQIIFKTNSINITKEKQISPESYSYDMVVRRSVWGTQAYLAFRKDR